MLTELGETLRDIRQENFERLLDMADRLEVSSAFLSAIEHGKKKPPSDFLNKLLNQYTLESDMKQRLSQGIDRANSGVTIRSNNPLARETAAVFARKVNTLSNDHLAEIKRLIEKGSKLK